MSEQDPSRPGENVEYDAGRPTDPGLEARINERQQAADGDETGAPGLPTIDKAAALDEDVRLARGADGGVAPFDDGGQRPQKTAMLTLQGMTPDQAAQARPGVVGGLPEQAIREPQPGGDDGDETESDKS